MNYRKQKANKSKSKKEFKKGMKSDLDVKNSRKSLMEELGIKTDEDNNNIKDANNFISNINKDKDKSRDRDFITNKAIDDK